jgi:hypothetical protein
MIKLLPELTEEKNSLQNHGHWILRVKFSIAASLAPNGRFKILTSQPGYEKILSIRCEDCI